MNITVTVNGQTYAHDVEPRLLLVHYLRDKLALTGTHVGCETSLCGACTVHMDGAAVRSCMTTLADAHGHAVVTIEGLSPDGSHPLQRAWEDHTVPQCGFCQPGQIMQAASLLKQTPRPTDQQIVDAMVGNLCRCGTYMRIRQAIKSAAESV